jgi:hypothetical protein
VGCSLDGSPSAVFKSLGEMAKKARSQVESELGKVGNDMPRAMRTNAAKVQRELEKLRADIQHDKNLMDPAKRSMADFAESTEKRLAGSRKAIAELAKQVGVSAREIGSAANAAGPGRDARGRFTGDGRTPFQRSVGKVGSRLARGALNLGARVAGDLASGAGVDFDVASLVAKNVDLEKRATDLSNSSYMVGENGANGQRQDAGAIIAQARGVADATGFDTGSALEGLQAFVGKTGDLETGRAVFKDLAMLSKATGTNLEDMVNAAGDVANGLGDIPDKAAVIQQVMQSIAGQGKLGAVEISDMATQMAKLAANAGQFAGDQAQNIALLGALAQEARQRGGASSATMAATSVAGFVNTLKTPARIAAFQQATGKKVYDAQGMIRNPQELIMEALRARGMDPEGFKKIFANVQGARAVEGFATIYRKAGGGEAGEAAVTAEFQRLTRAAMGLGETQDSFRRSIETTSSRVQIFNNKLQDTVNELQSSFMPLLQDLSPVLLAVVRAGTGFASWALGLKAKKEDQDEAAVQLRTLNETGQLNMALAGSTQMSKDAKGVFHSSTTTIAPGLVEAATADEGVLQKAIDAKRESVAEERQQLSMNAKLWWKGMGAPKTDEDVARQAKAGNQSAATYLQDASELSRMQEQLQELHSARNGVVEALLSGRVVVQVAGLKDKPAPKVDNKGRAPVSDTP